MSRATMQVSLERAHDQTRSQYKFTIRKFADSRGTYFFFTEEELELVTQALVDLVSNKDKLQDLEIGSLRKLI